MQIYLNNTLFTKSYPDIPISIYFVQNKLQYIVSELTSDQAYNSSNSCPPM